MEFEPFYGECCSVWMLGRPKAIVRVANFRFIFDLCHSCGGHRYWHEAFAIFRPMFLPRFRQPFTYLAHCDYVKTQIPQESLQMNEVVVSAFFPRIFGGGLKGTLEFPGATQIYGVATYLDFAP